VTGETAVVTPPPGAEKVVDLMEALKASIDQAKRERGARKGAGKKAQKKRTATAGAGVPDGEAAHP
jgi:non-homologous end joining protein Ku